MGLFFNRKNKKKVTINDYQKTETSNISGRIKEYDNPYKDYNNPKFHRTKREEELMSDFYRNNRNFIDDFELKLYSDKNDNSDDLKIRIEYLDEFKEICYSHSEGGKLYFQDMWEHCHNSKNECFSWRDNLLKDYNIQKQRERLYQAIPHAIMDNKNLLQKDIYKLLPEFDKGIIQSVIRELEKDKIILREKSKGSYKLSLI
ncbi:hypothetical protein [Anaerococcus cruorum]|uniref:hypothetical protein n=1 Tax=Anaerococcus sp. WGS1529 TaxID=3366812 RepID=UPI00372D62F9